MKGPLTDTEIDAFLADQAAKGDGTGWTDTQAFEAFLRADDGRPFVMINLMQLRDTAVYPDGFLAATSTGSDAEAAYGRQVFPLLLRRGSYPVARAERHATIINSLGQTAAAFDSFAMVRYRSRRDLIDMLGSPAFQEAGVHKWASLENTLVAPANQMPAFSVIGSVPYILLAVIAAVLGRSARPRWRPRAP